MHFQLKKTIAHVTVLSALIPVAACTGGQVKTQRNPELAPQQVASLRDPDLAPKRGQYSYDTVQGHVVRTTVTGECVQTIYWTPDGATLECHPSLFGKAAAPAPQAARAPAPQPRAATGATKPAPVVTESGRVRSDAVRGGARARPGRGADGRLLRARRRTRSRAGPARHRRSWTRGSHQRDRGCTTRRSP